MKEIIYYFIVFGIPKYFLRSYPEFMSERKGPMDMSVCVNDLSIISFD